MNRMYTLEEAYKKTVDYLVSKGIKIDQVIPINIGRYIIAKTKNNTNNYLIMFKRDVFRNFGFQFRLHGERDGVGESLNIDHYELSKYQYKVKTVLIIYRTGVLYSVPIDYFWKKGHSWKNKEGRGVLSLSIHFLKRETNLFENG